MEVIVKDASLSLKLACCPCQRIPPLDFSCWQIGSCQEVTVSGSEIYHDSTVKTVVGRKQKVRFKQSVYDGC